MEKHFLKKAGKSVLSNQNPRKKHICISNSMKHKRCWMKIYRKYFHSWKSKKFIFIQEKATKVSFVHRETTEVDIFHGKFVKTNSINGNSEEIHFQIGITKKAALIDWNSMRLKNVKWNFLEKVCVCDFFENRFHWLKFRGYRFGWKKINRNQLNWFKVSRSEYHRRKFLEIYSSAVESMKTAFIIGERKIKITSFRGLPGETISYKCNAWKMVSLKVNPGKLIWLKEKLWKLTSSIEKTHEPFSSISNPSKILSTIENNENRYHPLQTPLLNFL